jgi:hypothetical protein
VRDNYLITDGFVETVSSFETVSDELVKISTDPYRWKWVVLAMHSGLQGMMVLALQGSNGLHVLKNEDAKRWLDAYENGVSLPTDLQLDQFINLYKKIKSDLMLLYVNSNKFQPEGTQGNSIKFLNRTRNEYVHFTPKLWVLELNGLPDILLDNLDIAEFLAWHCGNIIWKESDLENRIRKAFKSIRDLLIKCKNKYNNG